MLYNFSMKLPSLQTIIEQLALLFASLIWTSVALAVISMFWVYQDIQARWQVVLNTPSQALAQNSTLILLPTATLWPGPGPTLTPTATKFPTPTSTRVVKPPNILPETLNADEPTPIPVIILEQEKLVEPTATPPVQPTAIKPPPTLTPTSSQLTTLPTETAQYKPTQTPTATPNQPILTLAPPTPILSSSSQEQKIVPTRLIIPSVGIDSKIIQMGWEVVTQNGQEYSIWKVADHAVGWHETSAGLGQVGNTVMTGHHNVQGEVFRDLVNVEVGDKITVYGGDQVFEYEITMKTIVKEKGEPIEVRQRNAQWIAPTDDERLTFVTCWPYTNNTHRVIVMAKPIGKK